MFDVFICHASEDKEAVVDPLAQGLLNAGLRVWYDRFSLKLGDSLRQSIDLGLSKSRFGVVVLSPNFFKKNWPQSELNALFSKQMAGAKTILPIWHEIDREDILQQAPLLVDLVAARTTDGIDAVIKSVLDVVEPEYSHSTRTGVTVSVSPVSVRLHAGGWSVKTPVILTNHGENPVYIVRLKILILTPGVPAESLQVDPGRKSTTLYGRAGPVRLSPDVIRLDCLDPQKCEAVYLIFHTINAKQNREFLVSGSVPTESKAEIQLLSFDGTPSVLVTKPNAAAIPFSLPESAQLKRFSIIVERTD